MAELTQFCCVCDHEVPADETLNGAYCRKCGLNLHKRCASGGDDGPWCPDCWLKLTRPPTTQPQPAPPAPLPEYRILQDDSLPRLEGQVNTLAAQGYEVISLTTTSLVADEIAGIWHHCVLRLSPQSRADREPMLQQVWRETVWLRGEVGRLEEGLQGLVGQVTELSKRLARLAKDVPVVE